jgi:hypothetical protein
MKRARDIGVAIGVTAMLSALVVVVFGQSASAVPAEELWVGHQVVYGRTSVPFMGDKQTRTDSYLLASVKREGGAIELTQLACKVGFKEIAGVKLEIPTEALLKLPKARIRFEPEQNLMKASPWHVGWHKADIDRDGNPGLSVVVDASICSGKIHVASATRSAAVAQSTPDGMMGKISVHVKQKILGSDSLCLRMFSSDSEEHQTGGFAYRRITEGTTCESLLGKPWPIEARFQAPPLGD